MKMCNTVVRMKITVINMEVLITPPYVLHRGSYMSAHVLLNLLNELGKR